MRVSHRDDGGISAEERKGRAEEGRHLHFGEEMKNERSETRKQEGGAHRQSGNHRDQDRGSEHGEHVLETEGKHLSAA